MPCTHPTVLVWHRESSWRHVDDVCCGCFPEYRCLACDEPVTKAHAAVSAQEHSVPVREIRRVAA